MGYHSGVYTPSKLPKHTSTISSLDPALKRGGRLLFERRVTVLALAAGFPAVLLSAFLLWYDGYSGRVQWTADLFLVLIWLGFSFNLKQRIVRPLQTLSNILAAIREGDYSIRGRRASVGDALGEVMLEVNDLGQTLREQRLGALEATALLQRSIKRYSHLMVKSACVSSIVRAKNCWPNQPPDYWVGPAASWVWLPA